MVKLFLWGGGGQSMQRLEENILYLRPCPIKALKATITVLIFPILFTPTLVHQKLYQLQIDSSKLLLSVESMQACVGTF